MNYEFEIKKLLDLCSHKKQVKFALYCAKDLDKFYDIKENKKIYEARQKCLNLLAKWLLEPEKVNKKELGEVANAANAFPAAAAYAETTKNNYLKDLYFYLFKMVYNVNNELLKQMYK